MNRGMILLTTRQMRALFALNRICNPYGGFTPIVARSDGAWWRGRYATIRFMPPAGRALPGIIPLPRLTAALSPQHERMTVRLDETGPWKQDDTTTTDMPHLPATVPETTVMPPTPPASRIVRLVETVITLDADPYTTLTLTPVRKRTLWHASPPGRSRGLAAALLVPDMSARPDPTLAADRHGGLLDYGLDVKLVDRLRLIGVTTVMDVENVSVHHLLNAGYGLDIPRLSRIDMHAILDVENALREHGLDPVPEPLTGDDLRRLKLRPDGSPTGGSCSLPHDPQTGLPRRRR